MSEPTIYRSPEAERDILERVAVERADEVNELLAGFLGGDRAVPDAV